MMIRISFKQLIPALAFLAVSGAPVFALAASNAANGQKVFAEECSECHSAKAGKNKKGPSLFGVAGLAAARTPDFEYSDGMRKSGLVWTADKLDAYIKAPKSVVPGGKMKYDGLESADARSDVIAYLMTLK